MVASRSWARGFQKFLWVLGSVPAELLGASNLIQAQRGFFFATQKGGSPQADSLDRGVGRRVLQPGSSRGASCGPGGGGRGGPQSNHPHLPRTSLTTNHALYETAQAPQPFCVGALHLRPRAFGAQETEGLSLTHSYSTPDPTPQGGALKHLGGKKGFRIPPSPAPWAPSSSRPPRTTLPFAKGKLSGFLTEFGSPRAHCDTAV